MPITVKMEIKRNFRIATDSEMNRLKRAALEETTTEIRLEARWIAKQPTGFKGRGRRTYALLDSIHSSEIYETTAFGRQVMEQRVYADDDEAPHAKWQEEGTGEYGPLGRPIVANMHWIEKSPPYRGRYVMARGKTGKTIPRLGARGKHGKMKTVYGDFDQFATQIHGSKPKHFMRGAANNKIIQANHRRRMREIARLFVKK